ncbi:MAG: Hpt domain-containing protein [Devosia sp.]|nr:Hpt domain-containing protein [Devosia sp.]
MSPRRPQPSAEDLAILDPDGQFRARLIEDRARLGGLTASAAPSAAERQSLERLAHQLAGAAGTFGFGAIGDLAIMLEDELIAVRQGDTGRARAVRVQQAIADLQRALWSI